MSDNDDEEAVRWAGIFKETNIDILTESDAALKVGQNNFNIKWCMLPVSLKL